MISTALAPLLVFGGLAAAPDDASLVAPLVDEVSKAALSDFVHALSGLGPRPVSDAAATEAASGFIEGVLRDWGYAVEREPFRAFVLDPAGEGSSWISVERWNIVATKVGLREPNNVVELGAHFDTVEGSPGADDNGSGVATLVEIARVAAEAPTARTLRFVFYGAEEVGLVGSEAHAKVVAARVAAGDERFHGAYVIDMLGYGSQARGSQDFPVRIPLLLAPPDRGNWLFIGGDSASAPLARDFRRAAATYEPGFVVWGFDGLAHLHPASRRGDHASYWDQGLRAFTVNDTAELRSPHYHRSTDTPETLDYELLLRAARSSCGWALESAGVLESDGAARAAEATAPASGD